MQKKKASKFKKDFIIYLNSLAVFSTNFFYQFQVF